jgi:hypothetical protein
MDKRFCSDLSLRARHVKKSLAGREYQRCFKKNAYADLCIKLEKHLKFCPKKSYLSYKNRKNMIKMEKITIFQVCKMV